MPGGWRIGPQAMLWWLADELARAVRPDIPFEEWLRARVGASAHPPKSGKD
ncbi:MAG: hypothetical protein U0401_28595 [Anaerolineae bacterium]